MTHRLFPGNVPESRRNIAQRGFVLAATLWMMAILAVAAAYFAQRISQAREQAEQAQVHTRALVEMHDTQADILFRIATTPISLYGLGATPAGAIALDDRAYTSSGTTLVRLQDNRGLLNLNLVDDAHLDRLLNILGAPAPPPAPRIEYVGA